MEGEANEKLGAEPAGLYTGQSGQSLKEDSHQSNVLHATFQIHARGEMSQGSSLTGRSWVLHPLPAFCSNSVTSEIQIHL